MLIINDDNGVNKITSERMMTLMVMIMMMDFAGRNDGNVKEYLPNG